MSRKKLVTAVLFCIMLVFSITSLYPLIWVALQSFKTETEFLQSIWTLPSSLNFQNYVTAFEKGNLSAYFFNSLRNTFATVVVDLAFISLAGFAFAKLKMKFKKFFYYFIILNLLIPTPIILLPIFILVRDLNIRNTLSAVVFPYYQGFAPLGLILTSNYFKAIPDELMEAAKIDGCNIMGVFARIMLPLAKPILATLAILGSMSAWNEYMWALISISDTGLYTLPVGISILQDKTSTLGYTPVFAALTVSALVIVVLFLIAQKNFVASITAGAVKG